MSENQRNQAGESLFQSYINSVIGLLQRIASEEEPAVQQAAELMAGAVASGGNIFAFGCTHSSLPIQDLVYRAGGLMLINPIFGPGIAAMDTRPATLSSEIEKTARICPRLDRQHTLKAGDALVVVSSPDVTPSRLRWLNWPKNGE